MGNPWEELAERQISAPRKARIRAVEKRLAKKKLEENILYDLWQRDLRDRRKQLTQHAGGAELLTFIEHMTLHDADALIALVEASPLRSAEPSARGTALSVLNNTIVYLRESNGLDPINDPLPDEKPSAFIILREILGDQHESAGQARSVP